MARPLRVAFPGALYHVASRGDNRGTIYLDDGDRRRWLEILGRVCERRNWVCHSYCQMTNHYHIVIETPEGNLSKGMRQLNGVYAQWLNRRHGRVGHVFQGRFKSILIEKDSYLLEVARYVVLNPVRVGMAESASEWIWSSYRATAGDATVPPWLAVDWLLSQFAASRGEAVRAYAEFVREGAGEPSPWLNSKSEIYLGSDSFLERMQAMVGKDEHISEVPRAQRRPSPESLESFARRYPHRKVAMAEAYLSGGYALNEIGRYFGVHYSTVSRAVGRYEKTRA